MGPMDVFKITAVLPLLVASIAFFISEEPIQKGNIANADSNESTSVTDANSGFAVEMQPQKSNVIPSLPIATNQNQIVASSDADTKVEVIVDGGNNSDVDVDVGVSEQIQSLWKAIKEPAIWKPALFLFLWQSTPTSDGAFLFFMTNDLGFGPEFLGRVRLATAAASLLGVWGYQKYLRTVRRLMVPDTVLHYSYLVLMFFLLFQNTTFGHFSFHLCISLTQFCLSSIKIVQTKLLQVAIKDILFWTSIASAPLGLINLLLISHANRSLGIPDGAFVFGDDVVLAILGEFAFLPTLVLAARICPPGVEAVLFATLMSIFNGASTVGTEVGALLTKMLGVTESNFDNLGLLTIICSLTSLYPLLFIGLLDETASKSEAEMEDEEANLSTL
jgi:hypothetical protein